MRARSTSRSPCGWRRNIATTSTPSARSRSPCRTAIRRPQPPISRSSDVADVKLETGAAYIYRENSQRFIPLKYSVRERDLGSTVAEAQERVAENVPLPPGYRMEWAGEFGALAGGQETARGHRAAQPGADPDAALQPVQFGARQPASRCPAFRSRSPAASSGSMSPA